jgi:hypothetical protein
MQHFTIKSKIYSMTNCCHTSKPFASTQTQIDGLLCRRLIVTSDSPSYLNNEKLTPTIYRWGPNVEKSESQSQEKKN